MLAYTLSTILLETTFNEKIHVCLSYQYMSFENKKLAKISENSYTIFCKRLFLLNNLNCFDYCLSMRVIGTKLPCVSLFGLLSFLPLQSTALSLSRSCTRSRYFTLPRKNFGDPDPEQWLSLKGKKYSRQKQQKQDGSICHSKFWAFAFVKWWNFRVQ